MSDFLTNLARRALGDGPRADVGPSPSAALAHQLALPIQTAPAPPPIGAIPSAAPAPVMRQAAPSGSAPVAAPASSMAQPPAEPAELSRPQAAPRDTISSPAAPMESPRAAQVERVAPAEPMGPAALPVQPRTRIDSFLDAARGDFDSGVFPSSASAPAAPPTPRNEPPATVIRAEPTAAVDGERALRPRVEPPLESRVAEPVTLRVPASHPDQPRDVASTPTAIERPLERAAIAPRIEPASDTFGPERAATAVALHESARTLAARDARGQSAAAAERRPVQIRIGAIDVHITSPATTAPAERPSLAGFDDYAGLRNPVQFFDE